MNRTTRVLSLLLCAAMFLGLAPQALAVAENVEKTAVEEPTQDKVEKADTDISQYGKYESEDGQPLSDDGHPLSRNQIALFSAASAVISKSTCVNFPAYTSPTWHCSRYYTDGYLYQLLCQQRQQLKLLDV